MILKETMAKVIKQGPWCGFLSSMILKVSKKYAWDVVFVRDKDLEKGPKSWFWICLKAGVDMYHFFSFIFED